MARHNKQITGELAKEYCKKFQTSATREIARALITDLQTYSKMVTDSWFTTTEYSTEKFCDKVLDRFYYRV